MATKRKLPVKRGIDNLKDMTSSIFDSFEVTTSKAKRRRKENSENSFGKQDSVDSLSKSYDNLMCDTSHTKYASKQFQMDQSKKKFSVSGLSSNDKKIRSKVKKSYSLNKTTSVSKQIKSKKSLALSNKRSININNDIECRITVKNHRGRAKKQASESINTVLPITDDIQITKAEGSYPQKYNTSQIPDSNDIHEKGKEDIITISSSFPEEKCSTSGSEVPYVAVSCINHSHNQILKPAVNVTAVPATSSMTSLSASTSAITAIPTPIPTFPVLHDGYGDLMKSEVGRAEHTILTKWKVDDDHTKITPEQKEKPDFVFNSAAERHDQQSGLSRSCSEIVLIGKCKDPLTSLPVPAVVMPFNSQQPRFLKVDTWGEYMLQNLEILYKKEMFCDFLLKFHGGEVLRVHRVILSAFTSLLSESDAMEGNSELLMPADLSFTSVEPVIRFVYSGHFEIQKSDNEMTSIYEAAKRLKVPLLTHFLDCHYPSLFSPCLISSRTQVEKHIKQEGLVSPKSSCSSILPSKVFQESIFKDRDRTSSTSESKPVTPLPSDEQMDARDITDNDNTKRLKVMDGGGQKTSVYYVVKNSRKCHSNIPVQEKIAAEEARPTRFELEEDSALKIPMWDPECSSSAPSHLPAALQVNTPRSVHPCPPSSTSVACKVSETCSVTSINLSHTVSKSSENVNERKQPYLPGFSTHGNESAESVENGNKSGEITNDLIVPNDSSKCVSVTDILDNQYTKENDNSKENIELMEKISNICKQLEEKESKDENEQLPKMECVQETGNKEQCLLSVDSEANEGKDLTKTCSTPVLSTPIKSILKKKKVGINKEAKHVSFLLDKNNELINEVATFSLSKEPSQSLIGVKKITGNLKSHRDTCLTVSKKKKVLMNLSVSDSETFESSSSSVKKSQGRKSLNSLGQSHSKSQANKGDIDNHAKIISEVLKKYPHLVKDKKKIRLKFLKKGNEKEGDEGKFKVQYFTLSDNKEAKPKSLPETHKSSPVLKNKMCVPRGAKSQPTYDCPECNDRTFLTYFMLKRHVTSDHKDISSAVLSRVENVPYFCYTCSLDIPLEFADYHSYQQHLKDVHKGNPSRSCNICGIKLTQKLELAYHQYKEHNKVSKSFSFPKCDLCDYIAKNDSALLKHRSQHTNAEKYTCSVCGVKFCSFGALQGHMQTKLCGTKPSVSHQCPFCPLTFARSYNLKAHCKSNHRSQKISSINISGSKKKKSQNVMPQCTESTSGKTERSSILKYKSDSDFEKNNTDTEVECETPIDQSSSEAEALSTVASSLVASLGLPEETVSQYMYPQANKMSHPNSLDEEKIEQVVSQPGSLAIHVEIPSASEYQSHQQCYDKPFNVQTSIPSSTSVSTLFPMMSSDVITSQYVPGQILPSHILPNGCTSSPSGSVHAAAPQGWTYVTYQVPTANKDLPVILTETASVNAPVNPDKNSSSENICQSRSTTTTTESIGISSESSWPNENACEELHILSVTDNQAHVNINQAPNHPVTQCYDSLPSPYM